MNNKRAPRNETLYRAFTSLISRLEAEYIKADPELSYEISPALVVGLVSKTRDCQEFNAFSKELTSDPVLGQKINVILNTESMTSHGPLSTLQILRNLATDLPRLKYKSSSAEAAYLEFESGLSEESISFEATAPLFYLEWHLQNQVLEICNDTRLVKCQINDAEYYKLPRPFSVMDPYLGLKRSYG